MCEVSCRLLESLPSRNATSSSQDPVHEGGSSAFDSFQDAKWCDITNDFSSSNPARKCYFSIKHGFLVLHTDSAVMYCWHFTDILQLVLLPESISEQTQRFLLLLKSSDHFADSGALMSCLIKRSSDLPLFLQHLKSLAANFSAISLDPKDTFNVSTEVAAQYTTEQARSNSTPCKKSTASNSQKTEATDSSFRPSDGIFHPVSLSTYLPLFQLSQMKKFLPVRESSELTIIPETRQEDSKTLASSGSHRARKSHKRSHKCCQSSLPIIQETHTTNYKALLARADDLFSNITTDPNQVSSSSKRRSRSPAATPIFKSQKSSESRLSNDVPTLNAHAHAMPIFSQEFLPSSQFEYLSQSSFSCSQKWVDLPLGSSQALNEDCLCFGEFPSFLEKPKARIVPQRSLDFGHGAETTTSAFSQISETVVQTNGLELEDTFSPNYSFGASRNNLFSRSNENADE